MREVKVKPRDPLVILQEFRNHLSQNYEDQSQLMVTFYRETARQDGDFIGVWEAVLEVLKRSYQNNDFDRVRFLKGRKSLFYQYKHNVKLKMQGGPVYINTLDVVKTMESFLSPEFEYQYQYRFEQPEVMNGKVVWVLHFSRREGTEIPCFNGKLLIDADSYALIRADFAYDKKSLKSIGSTFIQKEPIGYRTLPENCEYSVQYRQIGEKWYFYSAHCDVLFRVTQKKKDKTVYRNVTDILVTQQYPYPKKARFGPEGIVRTDDIFSEIIGSYDPEFWENYNVIKPEEELTNAIRQAGK